MVFPARNPRRQSTSTGDAPPAGGASGGSVGDAAAGEPRKRPRAKLETSAGGVVYRLHDGEPLFLLIRDSYKNWGFPKGHLETDEAPDAAAVREVREETGLADVMLDGEIDTIDWFFRFRGKLVHKVCHFFLMRTEVENTTPQRAEGITACKWARFEEATQLVSYANARDVLLRANAMVQGVDVNGDPAQAPRRLSPPASMQTVRPAPAAITTADGAPVAGATAAGATADGTTADGATADGTTAARPDPSV